MHGQQTPAERVSEIQAALRADKLDGWLFYDFRHSDPLAYRILKLDEDMAVSRRWFYYIPASGEPVKIVMSIEQFKLDSLPGKNSSTEAGRNCISVCAKCWNKIRQGIETHRDAVFADERHSLHVASRCRNDRTSSLVRRGDRQQRGARATVRGRLVARTHADAY